MLASVSKENMMVKPESKPEAIAAQQVVKVYPNPFQSTIQVSFALAERSKVHLMLVDMLGRVQQEEHLSLQEGSHTLSIGNSHLVAGTYIIKLVYGTEKHQSIIIKQ
jgi:hypothetical protein